MIDRSILVWMLVLGVLSVTVTIVFGAVIADTYGIENKEAGVGPDWMNLNVELPTALCSVCLIVWVVLIVLFLMFWAALGSGGSVE